MRFLLCSRCFRLKHIFKYSRRTVVLHHPVSLTVVMCLCAVYCEPNVDSFHFDTAASVCLCHRIAVYLISCNFQKLRKKYCFSLKKQKTTENEKKIIWTYDATCASQLADASSQSSSLLYDWDGALLLCLCENLILNLTKQNLHENSGDFQINVYQTYDFDEARWVGASQSSSSQSSPPAPPPPLLELCFAYCWLDDWDEWCDRLWPWPWPWPCDGRSLCVGVCREFRGLGTWGEARWWESCDRGGRLPDADHGCWPCELEWLFPWYWLERERWFDGGAFGWANTALFALVGVVWPPYLGVGCAAWCGVWYGVMNGVWPLGVYGVFTYDDWLP